MKRPAYTKAVHEFVESQFGGLTRNEERGAYGFASYLNRHGLAKASAKSKAKRETILVVWGEGSSRAAEDIFCGSGDINEMIGAIQDRGLERHMVRPNTHEFRTLAELNAFTQGIGEAEQNDDAQAYTIYGKKDIERYNKRLAEIEKALEKKTEAEKDPKP